jgi:hypothetical protein
MVAISIRGEGIAGTCCQRLLCNAGLQAAVETSCRPKIPAVMLGETTQKLFEDVFDRKDIFAGLPRISKRIVLWGSEQQPVILPHSAVVVSEQALLDAVQRELQPNDATQSDSPDWTIFASSPLPTLSVQHHFGSRAASAAATLLQPACDAESCWIESVENGWLFLLPSQKGEAWLLSVGDSAESLLSSSRLIHKQIGELRPAPGTFPSHPRVVFPLAGPVWLACGTAALGFDPLCGDGAGNAVREAILASAVVCAATAGGEPADLAAHYQARLLAGFKRHVALCLEFYGSGGSSPWWRLQLDQLRDGLTWCSQQLKDGDGARFRLSEFRLERAD